jgi:hypothetical protein
MEEVIWFLYLMLYNHVDWRHSIKATRADAEDKASTRPKEMEGLLEQFVQEISRHSLTGKNRGRLSYRPDYPAVESSKADARCRDYHRGGRKVNVPQHPRDDKAILTDVFRCE